MSRRLPALLKGRVTKLNVRAPLPYLRTGAPAQQFNQLRRAVEQDAGFDFLGTVDLLRLRGWISKKPGVSNRSRHICGDAFDFDTSDDRYCLVNEVIQDKQYWRVFVWSTGPAGKAMRVDCDLCGKLVDGRFIDFTKLAIKHGFTRVPAWRGWSHRGQGALLREFSHYQLADDLTWNEAVAFLYGRHHEKRPLRFAPNDRIFGLNDRGKQIYGLQLHLAALTFLALPEVDGIFGLPTYKAVKSFQQSRRMVVTGIADAETRRQLALGVLEVLVPAGVIKEQ